MNPCIVIIPIYSSTPNLFELASFKQALTILKKHPISIITHNKVNLSKYIDISNEVEKSISINYFSTSYFNSISSYNELCLSVILYKTFINYKYILIYQLDAWVFRDDLIKWCNKGYDYIGAPWFDNWGRHEVGNKLWEVGNGGFSLRRTHFFLNLLSYKWPLSHSVICNRGFITFIKSILKSLGYHNTIMWYISQEKNYQSEDYFLTCYIKKITKNKKLIAIKPTAEEAIYFAFERSPSYLYKLCNNILPFGCHAYNKNEFSSFWSKFITI